MCAGTPKPAEKFELKSPRKSFPEQYIKEYETRYPSNDSLLKSINSNCNVQFEKVSKVIVDKIALLNKELDKKLDLLPTRHEVAEMHGTQKQEYQKRHEQYIKYLQRTLEDQQAMHNDNNTKLKLLQENLHYQYRVLLSVFVCFLIAVFSLCMYNIGLAFLVVLICFNLYYISDKIFIP